MASAFFITHPDVVIDPTIPVPDWFPTPTGIGHVASSLERKARDGADVLATHLGLVPSEHAGLGENDRSATGHLPKPAVEALADAFFANPTESMQGWELQSDWSRIDP